MLISFVTVSFSEYGRFCGSFELYGVDMYSSTSGRCAKCVPAGMQELIYLVSFVALCAKSLISCHGMMPSSLGQRVAAT